MSVNLVDFFDCLFLMASDCDTELPAWHLRCYRP